MRSEKGRRGNGIRRFDSVILYGEMKEKRKVEGYSVDGKKSEPIKHKVKRSNSRKLKNISVFVVRQRNGRERRFIFLHKLSKLFVVDSDNKDVKFKENYDLDDFLRLLNLYKTKADDLGYEIKTQLDKSVRSEVQVQDQLSTLYQGGKIIL